MKLELGVTQAEAKELAVGGGDFEPLPDGQYEVSCSAIEHTTSKAGSLMIKWTLDVINNDDAAGRKLFSYTVINEDESKNFGLYAHFAAFGLSIGKDGSVETDDALGREAIANVIQQQYQDKITNSVKSVIGK
jgi:hypothetical protein